MIAGLREYDATFASVAFTTAVDVWEVNGFHCLEIAPDNFLATYTLKQGERVSRRATIWRRTPEGWQIVYHQGTLVQ